MNPKSGIAPSPVNPAAPEVAEDADAAEPGQVARVEGEPVQPHNPTEEEIEEGSWIEIELVDEEDNPVPGERYSITLPNGSVAQGTVDENGFARVEGIDPGTCQITFPNLDREAWEKI